MAMISLQKAAGWCGGRIDPKYQDMTFCGACIDSRKLLPGELFVALIAARDGHDYIPGALEKGAAAVLCSRLEGDYPAIVVDDTRIALGQIAAGLLREMNPRIVGVTGSVGKSTTKEMIASVLETTYRVSKTPANHNNDLGMPAAVLKMDAQSEAVVLEMGMSHFGEIEYLSRMAKPQIGVIINVGTMHIENLGSREGILQAKLEITKGMEEDGKLILFGDNDYLWGAKDTLCVPTAYFGTKEHCDLRAENIRYDADGIRYDAVYGQLRFPIYLPLEGEHYVADSLAAIHVGLQLGVTPENIQKGLACFQTMEGRQEMFAFQGYQIIKDCYNAGPESMEAALKVLGNRSGRKIAVLGDMLELGAHSAPAHRKVGSQAAQYADVLLCYGPESEKMLLGAKEAGMEKAYHYSTREDLARALRELVNDGDVLLFKASRGIRMELALELFMKEI